MSLPKEIQDVVDICNKEGYGDAVIALFDNCMGLTDGDYNAANEFLKALLEDIDHEFLDSQTGGEGEGEYCYSVIRIGDKYFKAEWSYYSYNGCDYDYIEDTIKEVKPSKKTITVYN